VLTVHDPLADTARCARMRVLRMIHAAGAGHPGGSLSCLDALTVIMCDVGRFALDQEPRDWLVLGKGHAVPALYALLVELGGLDEQELSTYRQLGSRLQGHPDRRKLPEVQISTGHLGQGLSIGVGLALGEQLSPQGRHTYVLLGDGDLHEGQTWEALMAASHLRLTGLTLVIDANGLTQHGPVEQVMGVEPLAPRLRSFGWAAVEVDGHDHAALRRVLTDARAADVPTVVVSRTVKGKGVSFMEGVPEWHSRGLSDEELARALAELDS
jgi:transketolase